MYKRKNVLNKSYGVQKGDRRRYHWFDFE